MKLSAIERKILNCIQRDIPLVKKPFKVLAKRAGISEEKLLEKIGQLKAKGLIHRFSAGISHKRLGFKSTLVALRVAEGRVDSVAGKIIVHPEVTHCFLRRGDYNLWTVLIYRGRLLKGILDKLAKEVGRKNILNLPTQRQFKLKTTIKL